MLRTAGWKRLALDREICGRKTDEAKARNWAVVVVEEEEVK